MKGVIIKCLEDLVTEMFGRDRWKDILEVAGLNKRSMFLVTTDIDDDIALKLFESACNVLDLSLSQVGDAFGEYWVNSFAPKIYSIYYRRAKSAREFLLRMDHVHVVTTKQIPNAHPPRFDYEWKDSNTLIMTYKSKRNLIDFMVGLIKGVGTYYKEKLTVTKQGPDKMEIIFAKS